ncbi:FecR domain-containing protein [Reichenbachiella sp. MALMAid0571]|uniref:FecR family protein n=1 Tax=Reichenbachiella sp. MALMAid0571 TaxID=3143939 RepID=UPI0032DE9699
MNEQLLKWLNGELSEDELKKTIPAHDMLKYKQIIEEVERWVPDNDSVVFNPKDVTSQPKKIKRRFINPWITMSVAASVLLVVSTMLWLSISPDITTYSTSTAQTKEILLPDGTSKITLAPDSEVSWHEGDWSVNKRNLILKGKALFVVRSGSPFEVKTGNGKVEVLGTTFEVDEFEEGLNVVCYEGSVKTTANDNRSVIVEGGEAYLYYEGEWEDRINIGDSSPSWLKSETKFEKAPLIQVIKSLEKLYNIEIFLGSISLKRRFTGSYPNDKLDVALQIVFNPFEISYELKGNKLYLTE